MTPIKKLANVFYTDAEPSDRVSGVARYSANRYQKTHGGLWVGGDVTVAESGVAFVPNTLNRNLHKDIRDIEIPQSTIKSIQYRFGWFTGICGNTS